MALSFGWKAQDVRESIWIDDTALMNVPASAKTAWEDDGDASHLRPYAKNGIPQIITFRTLTSDERQLILSYYANQPNGFSASGRAANVAFRIAVDFQGLPETFKDATGRELPIHVKEYGVRMLADEFVASLQDKYPTIVAFYGGKILDSAFASLIEKKASSQPSTPTPSKAEGSNGEFTAASPAAEAAPGVQ